MIQLKVVHIEHIFHRNLCNDFRKPKLAQFNYGKGQKPIHPTLDRGFYCILGVLLNVAKLVKQIKTVSMIQIIIFFNNKTNIGLSQSRKNNRRGGNIYQSLVVHHFFFRVPALRAKYSASMETIYNPPGGTF